MNYGFDKREITHLIEVDDTDTKTYYNYNGVDFYYRKRTDDDRLLVSFHGCTQCNTPLPVFRGHDWKYNILCISDKLLETYPGLLIGIAPRTEPI